MSLLGLPSRWIGEKLGSIDLLWRPKREAPLPDSFAGRGDLRFTMGRLLNEPRSWYASDVVFVVKVEVRQWDRRWQIVSLSYFIEIWTLACCCVAFYGGVCSCKGPDCGHPKQALQEKGCMGLLRSKTVYCSIFLFPLRALNDSINML